MDVKADFKVWKAGPMLIAVIDRCLTFQHGMGTSESSSCPTCSEYLWGNSGPEGRKDLSKVTQQVRAGIRDEIFWLPAQRFSLTFDFLNVQYGSH